ncbi:MAG: hypothetical protein Q7U44_06555, partial [Desulfuromonadales bacterium]|nr:hypothetical protein [Desulfuromonadales bacterium]
MRWNWLVIALTLTFLSGLAWGQETLPETSEPTESIPFAAPQEGSVSPPGSQPVTSSDLLGGRTGYIHPFLSVSSFYTSNLFRTESNELSDRYLVIAPGLWLALPARNQRAPEIGTSNTAPGGLSLSRFTAE